MNGQPEAIRLAQALEYCDASVARQAINELHRMHAENASLSTGYDAARLGIKSLQAELVKESARTAAEKLRADQMTAQHRMQCEMGKADRAKVQELESMLAAVGAGGVEPLRKSPVIGAEFSQFLSDVMTAAGLVEHGKQCKALATRLGDTVMRLRVEPPPKADHLRGVTKMVPSDHLRDATKMTLDEAIEHADEVAGCGAQCGVEHAQLAAWLRELRDRRVAEMAPVEPTETQKQVVKWLATGSVGKSSKCMAMWLAFGELTEDRFCPADPDDLDRCLKLLDKAPGLRPLIPKMAEVSEKWARLVPRWDEVEASHLAEVGLGWTKARRAPKTYDLMAGILRTEHMRA